jgi:hypothetical protein
MVRLGKRRNGIQVCAHQIVEPRIEFNFERIVPASHPVIEHGALVFARLIETCNSLWMSARPASVPSRSRSALRSNHCRCKRHSLPGGRYRYATRTNST